MSDHEKSVPEPSQPSQEELDKLDADLHAIESLYRSRCVPAPQGNNVKVTEIKDKD